MPKATVRQQAIGSDPAQLQPDALGRLVLRLEDMILSGELGPGAKLREEPLSESLEVGRGLLREAIRILEGRRLLERVPNAGVRVIAPTLDDFEELLVTREALEGMAARLAAENMTLAQVRELRALADVLQAADLRRGSTPYGVLDAGPDRDFHRKIAIGSRNARIEKLLCEDLYSLLRFFRFRAAQVRPDAGITHAEHDAVVRAIERRDGDAAEAAMRAHVRRSRGTLLGHLRAQQPGSTGIGAQNPV